MKLYLRIASTFSFLIILASLAMPVCAVEKIATEHKDGSDKVLKFTDYNDLKGAELIRVRNVGMAKLNYWKGKK